VLLAGFFEIEVGSATEGCLVLRGDILLAGVLRSFGGEPALISHSAAIGVAVRTLVLRGIWVLIRRFSAPMS
jgi:hypothetical protein